MPERVQDFASFDRSILKHPYLNDLIGDNRIEKSIKSIRVPVVTIKQLLHRYPGTPIIALQIDTEGHDFAVIKSAVKAGCLPKIINYETKHLSYGDQFECRALLSSHGYSFLSYHQDTLAYRSHNGSPAG